MFETAAPEHVVTSTERSLRSVYLQNRLVEIASKQLPEDSRHADSLINTSKWLFVSSKVTSLCAADVRRAQQHQGNCNSAIHACGHIVDKALDHKVSLPRRHNSY